MKDKPSKKFCCMLSLYWNLRELSATHDNALLIISEFCTNDEMKQLWEHFGD